MDKMNNIDKVNIKGSNNRFNLKKNNKGKFEYSYITEVTEEQIAERINYLLSAMKSYDGQLKRLNELKQFAQEELDVLNQLTK